MTGKKNEQKTNITFVVKLKKTTLCEVHGGTAELL